MFPCHGGVCRQVVWMCAACMILPLARGRFIQQVGFEIAKPLATHTLSSVLRLLITVPFANPLRRIFVNCSLSLCWLQQLLRGVCVALAGWVEHWADSPRQQLAPGGEGGVPGLRIALPRGLGPGPEKHQRYHQWGGKGNACIRGRVLSSQVCMREA